MSVRCAVVLVIFLTISVASSAEPEHVDVVLNGMKVRITLTQADRMRRELVDRLATATKPELAQLRGELAAAVPWVDRNGQLHYGRWFMTGAGQELSLSAAYPPQGPLGLPLMGNPGPYATFERRAGQWRLTNVGEASTTR